MDLIEFTATAGAVRLRYADDPQPEQAGEWLDLCVKNADLKLPSGTTITERDGHYLSELKLAALRHTRGILDAEIERLRDLRGRTP